MVPTHTHYMKILDLHTVNCMKWNNHFTFPIHWLWNSLHTVFQSVKQWLTLLDAVLQCHKLLDIAWKVCWSCYSWNWRTSYTSETVSNVLLTEVVPFLCNEDVTGLPIGRAGWSGSRSIAWKLLQASEGMYWTLFLLCCSLSRSKLTFGQLLGCICDVVSLVDL